MRRSEQQHTTDTPATHCASPSQQCSYVTWKTFGEWLLAAMLMGLSMPLSIVVASLIKATSPGPVLYSQVRLGLRGRPYRIYKFRTMRHDAELRSGPVWAAKHDARITPIG